MAYKLCKDCGQPMLPKGVKKRPDYYDHAQGCPSAPAPSPASDGQNKNPEWMNVTVKHDNPNNQPASPASEQDERLDDLCEKLRAELRIPCWCEPGDGEGEITLCHNCGFLRSNIAQEIAAERKRIAQMLDDQGCLECAAAIRKLEER